MAAVVKPSLTLAVDDDDDNGDDDDDDDVVVGGTIPIVIGGVPDSVPWTIFDASEIGIKGLVVSTVRVFPSAAVAGIAGLLGGVETGEVRVSNVMEAVDALLTKIGEALPLSVPKFFSDPNEITFDFEVSKLLEDKGVGD